MGDLECEKALSLFPYLCYFPLVSLAPFFLKRDRSWVEAALHWDNFVILCQPFESQWESSLVANAAAQVGKAATCKLSHVHVDLISAAQGASGALDLATLCHLLMLLSKRSLSNSTLFLTCLGATYRSRLYANPAEDIAKCSAKWILYIICSIFLEDMLLPLRKQAFNSSKCLMKRPISSSQGETCWISRFHNKHLNLFFSCGFNTKSVHWQRTYHRRSPKPQRRPSPAARNWRTVVEEYRLPLSPKQLCCHNICWCYLNEQKALLLRREGDAGHRGSIKTITTFLAKCRAMSATKQGKWEFFSEGSSEGEKRIVTGTCPPDLQ